MHDLIIKYYKPAAEAGIDQAQQDQEIQKSVMQEAEAKQDIADKLELILSKLGVQEHEINKLKTETVKKNILRETEERVSELKKKQMAIPSLNQIWSDLDVQPHLSKLSKDSCDFFFKFLFECLELLFYGLQLLGCLLLLLEFGLQPADSFE